MTETPDIHIFGNKRRLIGWLLFPVALFPLAALLTYDWRATALQIPSASSTNWVGPMGDFFAFYGYALLGFAIWLIPLYCIIIGCRIIAGDSLRPGMKALWRSILLVSMATLLQIMEHNAPGIRFLTEKTNIMNAGGIAGFLISDKILIPLLSDVGASVLSLTLLVFSLIGSIGLKNISNASVRLCKWMLGAKEIPAKSAPAEQNPASASAGSKMADVIEAIKSIKKDARSQNIAEKAENPPPTPKARQTAQSTRHRDPAPAAKDPVPQPPHRQSAPQKTPPSPKAPPPDANSGTYRLPPVDVLNPLAISQSDHSDVEAMGESLIKTLNIFGVSASLSYTVRGPVVTKYAVKLAPGTLYNNVRRIEANLKGALRAKSLRIETPIPGEEEVGIEVPNKKPATISFREIFESDTFKESRAALPLLFGKDAAGCELVADLADMPHMLVAGATGQGKSVCLNALINGLLMTRTPDELKLIMVDPKSVEFMPYSRIPHLLVPVITDNNKVVCSLQWAIAEMERRLKMFSAAGVRNIASFNSRLTQTEMFPSDSATDSGMPATLPYIVIIIDEVADLMAACAKQVVPGIARLTAKARAAGIHLILATQRPDTTVITGTIKANIPGRVAFKTSQANDSRTILDAQGAENLIGKGDMLFKGKDGNLVRAQGAWIADNEIDNITSFISQYSAPQFDEVLKGKLDKVKEAPPDDFSDDESDEEKAAAKQATRMATKAAASENDVKKAIECLIDTNRASVSNFQRQMSWGYNHAAKIIDILADRGIVSKAQGMGPRQILMSPDELKALLNEPAVAEQAGEDDDIRTDADFDGQTGEEEFTEETI